MKCIGNRPFYAQRALCFCDRQESAPRAQNDITFQRLSVIKRGEYSMEKIRALYDRYQDIILYAVFGALTTLVNLAFFYLFTRVFVITPDSTLLPNVIANILAILFAFVTNRTIVFRSTQAGAKGIIAEAAKFFAGRALTMLLDLAIVYVLVDLLGWAKMPVKVASTVVVIILNYVISKRFVFRKK